MKEQMLFIAKMTRLTGSSAAKFPQIGWLNGNRNTIASIEKNTRAAVMVAADIAIGDDLEDMQEAGKETSVYALIGTRTLTAQQATEADITAATGKAEGEIGYVWTPEGDGQVPLVTVEPYQQNVVLKCAESAGELYAQCGDSDIEAQAVTTHKNAKKIVLKAATEAANDEAELISLQAKFAEQRIARKAAKQNEAVGAN